MRAAIILAAGRSKRFGAANKLLLSYRGRALLRRAIETALQAPVGRAIVVTGADRSRVERLAHSVSKRRVVTVYAPDYRKGRHASLLEGLSRLRRNEREVLVFLGDTPCVAPHVAGRVTLNRKRADGAVRASYRDRPGHPVLICDIAAARRRMESGQPPLDRNTVRLIEAGRGAISDIDRRGDALRFPGKTWA